MGKPHDTAKKKKKCFPALFRSGQGKGLKSRPYRCPSFILHYRLPVNSSVVSDSLQPNGLYPPQAALSMEFSRHKHWSGLPFPSPWSHSVMSDSLWPHGLYSPWNSPGQNTVVGSLSPLQGIFLTQGSNPCLPHCRQTLYQLSHPGSPRILEWVAYPFFSISSKPRNRTRVSCIEGGFFNKWTTREAPNIYQEKSLLY